MIKFSQTRTVKHKLCLCFRVLIVRARPINRADTRPSVAFFSQRETARGLARAFLPRAASSAPPSPRDTRGYHPPSRREAAAAALRAASASRSLARGTPPSGSCPDVSLFFTLGLRLQDGKPIHLVSDYRMENRVTQNSRVAITVMKWQNMHVHVAPVLISCIHSTTICHVEIEVHVGPGKGIRTCQVLDDFREKCGLARLSSALLCLLPKRVKMQNSTESDRIHA